MGIAILVYAIAAILLVIALLRGTLEDPGGRWPYVALLAMGATSYGILVALSWAEVEVALFEKRLRVVIREGVLSQTRERTHEIVRSDIAKVRERVVMRLVHNVFVEGRGGRRLCGFPRFLAPGEHDEMVSAIIEWGGRS